jgi:hypothetical protein
LTTIRRSKPARSQQRWIEHVRTVGRRDEDHTVVQLQSVHFDEELIERLLPFMVPVTESGPSVPADGVDLIDEHDAGCVLLALLEQVADAGCPDAYEHLNEIRAADREDRHVSSLACASVRAYASLASLS